MKTYEKPNLVMNDVELEDVVLYSQLGDLGELEIFSEE